MGKGRVDLERLGLVIVPAGPVHRNYVISTWVMSASDAVAKRGAKRSVCRMEEDRLAKRALASECVFVLADAADNEVAYGWIAGERGLLQWGYLPPSIRGRGLFRTLVRRVCGKELQYTRKPRGYRVPGYWTYNPYRIGE